MTNQDAIYYLLYMKHNVHEKSPIDIALDTAIEALKQTEVLHGQWIDVPDANTKSEWQRKGMDGMTIEEAIEHCKEVAKESREAALSCARENAYETAISCKACGQEHEQLAEWLTELKQRREAEIMEKDGENEHGENRETVQ